MGLLRRKLMPLAIGGFALLGASATAQAATFTVNDPTDAPLATSSSKTCASTHNGSCTLRAAVQAADNTGGSNSVSLPAGGFRLTIPPAGPSSSADPATGDLDITGTDHLTITGAGSGSTTIDANLIDRAFAVQTGAGLSLSGMTIQNGAPSAKSTGFQSGGAIYSDGALFLTGDDTLQHNSATGFGSGGAIYNDSDTTSTLSVAGSRFSDDTAALYGGAIYDQSGSLGTTSITGSTFSGNTASSDQGGALYLSQSGTATLTADTFSGNIAAGGGGSGGALIAYHASVNVSQSSFTSNSAPGNGTGGAISADINSGYTLTLSDNSFDGNSAQYGGGLYYFSGDLSVSGNTFSDNSAPGGGGGAIYQDESGNGVTATLTNNTLDGNSASYGGGLDNGNNAVTLKLANNTIARNRASGFNGGAEAGGILFPGSVGAGSTYSNNVVAENVGGDCSTGTNANALTAALDLGNNLDSDSSCFAPSGSPLNAGDKPGVDPKLGPLADNGGPTPTDALLPGSPAIDAGNDAQCPATDQRGVPRPQGPHCDIGAFEAAPARLSLSKAGPSSVTVGLPFNYTITVSDGGPAASTGTTVTDQLPANSVLYGVNPSQGGCTASGSPVTLTCNLGAVHNGASATVTVSVAINKPGTVTNSASASNDQGASSSSSATTAVNPAPAPPTGSKPTAKTGRSQAAGKHRERVFGQVSSGGQPTVYFVQYGRTNAYGLITPLRRIGGGTVNLKELLRRLVRGGRYHYRVVAINDSGISYGRDRTFRTRRR